MKIFFEKYYAYIFSFIIHFLLIFVFLFPIKNKVSNKTQKFVEVGFAGNNLFKQQKHRGKSPNKQIKITKQLHTENTASLKKTKKYVPDKETSVDKYAVHNIQENAYSGEESAGSGNGSSTQTSNGNANEQNNIYHVAVDQMPYPFGGDGAIQSKLLYPAAAKTSDIQGTVYVTAFIDENGVVQKTIVIKGLGFGCDDAASKAVKETLFHAGYMRGVPVKVQMTIPIKFSLKN
jgi:TonB family protein